MKSKNPFFKTKSFTNTSSSNSYEAIVIDYNRNHDGFWNNK